MSRKTFTYKMSLERIFVISAVMLVIGILLGSWAVTSGIKEGYYQKSGYYYGLREVINDYEYAFNLTFRVFKECVQELGVCCYNLTESEVNDMMGFESD